MPGSVTGDMSLFFQTQRQTATIKERLQTLTQEMSTGEHADLTAHLRGDTNRVVGLDNEIARIDSFALAASDLSRFLSQQQIQLTEVNNIRQTLAQEFLTVSNGSTEGAIDDSAAAGRIGFANVVSRLNGTVGDRSLFAGAAVENAALAPAEDMLTDLVTLIGGATSTAAVIAVIDTWFDTPGGGFDTVGYQGDTGTAPNRQIADGDTVEVSARADDVAVRGVLKSLAISAVVDIIGAGLPADTQTELIAEAGQQLNANSSGLIDLAANVGSVEARVEQVTAMHAAKRTAFSMARNELTQVDSFATALNLQDVQTQLEIQFSMTARLSGLSLANYI